MPRKQVNKWLQPAFKEHTKGAMHRMLAIPQSETLPFTFLQEIVNTPIGQIAHNPTQIGTRKIKVTRLVKARANLALNAKRIGRNK